MTQEDKELLLKDLCTRLPYGVKVLCLNDSGRKWYNLEMVDIVDNEVYLTTTDKSYTNRYAEIETVKPYLFPISNMTEEQENEWDNLFIDPLCERVNIRHTREEDLLLRAKSGFTSTDYLDKNKFDYRGLIPKGLANDATGLNIY